MCEGEEDDEVVEAARGEVLWKWNWEDSIALKISMDGGRLEVVCKLERVGEKS